MKLFICLFVLCTSFAHEPPKVSIPGQGTVIGKQISLIRTQRMLAYLGIPYAQPPVDELRFSAPRIDPLPSWAGVRNATKFAPACLQGNSDFNVLDLPFMRFMSNFNSYESYENQNPSTDEDCLYLNVYVPFGQAPPEGFATIVWFHPGNFTTGDPAVWNPFTLVYRYRVIVVTFAYRLNVMGFFSTNDEEAPGNYGMMDQQAALIWVKDNINLFGGDSNNICLMGSGSGAVSIGLHMLNKRSKELFAKAIIMSGNILSSSAVKYPQEDNNLLESLSINFGCYQRPTSALLSCLKRVRADALVALTLHINWKPLINFGFTNNTSFLLEPPKNLFERGEYYKVPILTGYTDMEEALFIDGLDPQHKSNEQNFQEFVFTSLADLISKDFQNTTESNDSCVYNYNHIIDSVLFFYGPTKPITDPDMARKLLATFSTEKNYGSLTYLQATYVSKDQPTYVYRFDEKPTTQFTEIPEWISVPHLFDLIYVWGMPFWAPLPDQEWDMRDKRLSDIIMSLWTTFAKSSNPTKHGVYPILWDLFTQQDPKIMIIDRHFSMSNVTSLIYKSFEFWNDYYPKVVNISTQCCNVT